MIPTLFKVSTAVLAVLLCSFQARSQDIEWEQSYGGKHTNYLFDALIPEDYEFILKREYIREFLI
jgi:hypothetical protein